MEIGLRLIACTVLIVLSDVHPSNCGRILAIISAPAYSHQIAYRALWQRLAQRGHEVVLLTTLPVKDKHSANYTEIDLYQDNFRAFDELNTIQKRLDGVNWVEFTLSEFFPMVDKLGRLIFERSEVRELYKPNSGVHFDVVIAEVVAAPAAYGFAHRFNAPLIGAASLGLYNYNQYLIGGQVLPSHPSSWEMTDAVGFDLPFWSRLKNFVYIYYYMFLIYNYWIPYQHAIAKEYLGDDVPDLMELERNSSIILVYQQQALTYPRPHPPNVIFFGGSHLHVPRHSLTKELQKFTDDAPNGFIYVSLGSLTRGLLLPSYIVEIFIDVLSKLPCKVVWKYEKPLPRNFSNIYTAEWLPQYSLLAHPNLRVYVYQGGLQSTEEAVEHGVPLVGIPIIADQDHQVTRMVAWGVARFLELRTLTREKLDEAIRDVLTDKRYKERMVDLRKLLNDRPYDPLNHSIWWIEYVMRHKGAPHLQCSIANESWYQRGDMDVIMFLAILVFIVTIVVLIIVYKCLRVLFGRHVVSRVFRKKKVE